jgi:hypothetical protein
MGSSDPSSGRRRSGGRVGRVVEAFGEFESRAKAGGVYQDWGGAEGYASLPRALARE